MLIKQKRTYRDGTTWLRWVETPTRERDGKTLERAARLPAGWNCATCRPNDREWSEASSEIPIPRVDLIYECMACGCSTYQGRLAPSPAVA